MAAVQKNQEVDSGDDLALDDDVLGLDDADGSFANQTLAYSTLCSTSMIDYEVFYDPANITAKNVRGQQPGMAHTDSGH